MVESQWEFPGKPKDIGHSGSLLASKNDFIFEAVPPLCRGHKMAHGPVLAYCKFKPMILVLALTRQCSGHVPGAMLRTGVQHSAPGRGVCLQALSEANVTTFKELVGFTANPAVLF